jgi:hypothetical protein
MTTLLIRVAAFLPSSRGHFVPRLARDAFEPLCEENGISFGSLQNSLLYEISEEDYNFIQLLTKDFTLTIERIIK